MTDSEVIGEQEWRSISSIDEQFSANAVMDSSVIKGRLFSLSLHNVS